MYPRRVEFRVDLCVPRPFLWLCNLASMNPRNPQPIALKANNVYGYCKKKIKFFMKKVSKKIHELYF